MTAVLVCADGLSPQERGGVGTGKVVDGLCDHPELIREHASGTPTLVLVLCGGRFSLGAVQREVRRAGLDPLGVEIVTLEDADGDRARLAVLLAGAVARAEAFRGSRPEQAKLAFPGQASRRALLTFSLPEYHVAPAIDAARCAADRGCRACVDVCPRQALTVAGGQVVYDRVACEPCGRCVTACPTGAVVNPAATPAQVEAQVLTLLDSAAGPAGPRGIVYRCRRAERPETAPGWYPVTVPCTGMLTPAWLLAPLLLGAGSVAARPCGDAGCPLGHDDVVAERVAWCQELLATAGLPPGLVTTAPEQQAPHRPLPARGLSDPFGPLGSAAVVSALAAAAGGARLHLMGAGAPLGLVAIDPGACTGCGTCAAGCPTHALSLLDDGQRRSLDFDPRRCVACGLCVRHCPEVAAGAIAVEPGVDTEALGAGTRRVWEGENVACRSCGGPVAPAALLARIGALVDDERILAALAELCLDCRGVRADV